MKNWKTTLLGYLDYILVIIAILWFYFDVPGLRTAIPVLAIIKLIGDGLAKNLSKDHDKDNNEAIMDVGGVGPKRPPKDD